VSLVETELREQPSSLARFLAAEEATARTLAHELEDVDYVFIASRGSSSNAARYAQYLFGTVNRLPVAFATPSLHTLYGAPPRLKGAFAIAISQSGASPDVVAVLAEARRQGRPTLAITNERSSDLARTADWVLPLHAGEERAVAATKTYSNSLAAIALLSAALTRDERRFDGLRALPSVVDAQIGRSLDGVRGLDRYRRVDGGTVVARGVNYCTAFEIALKIRELSGAPFEPFSSADLMHGPIAALHADRPVIVVAPSGPALESLRALLAKLHDLGLSIVAISDDSDVLATAETPLQLVPVAEWLSPLTAVVPGQLAAIRLAKLAGADVDHPARLTKVTLTR
jgi:glucosamine--fructose-6-phosphate aminotransferase (isomerizing)